MTQTIYLTLGLAFALIAMPLTAFAQNGNRAHYEDTRYQKWASMTAEQRDLAKQRGETSYGSWNEYQAKRDAQRRYNDRVLRHHPDAWQGKTAEEKDRILQRNSVYQRTNVRDDGRHYPDKWQGKTAEQKDMILQRNSSSVNKVTVYDKNGRAIRSNRNNAPIARVDVRTTTSKDTVQQ